MKLNKNLDLQIKHLNKKKNKELKNVRDYKIIQNNYIFEFKNNQNF